MTDITSRDLARHARLFELLRQQNLSKVARKKIRSHAEQTLSDHQAFKQRAAASLSDASDSL